MPREGENPRGSVAREPCVTVRGGAAARAHSSVVKLFVHIKQHKHVIFFCEIIGGNYARPKKIMKNLRKSLEINVRKTRTRVREGGREKGREGRVNAGGQEGLEGRKEGGGEGELQGRVEV